MKIQTIRDYCMAKPGATADHPFGPDTLVFKVMGKMFALTGDAPRPRSINLKGDPEDNLALREQFEGITPGYHMNKDHWNTVGFDSDVPEALIRELIDGSYDLVVKGLPKRLRDELADVREGLRA